MESAQMQMLKIISAAKELRELQKINQLFQSPKRHVAMLQAEFNLDLLLAEFEPELMRFKNQPARIDIIDYDTRS